MFVGHQTTSLDAKNRAILPARMRPNVEAASPRREVYIVPWLDGCLALFMPEQWEAMARALRANPYEIVEARRVWRNMFSFAEQAAFDAQWRLLISKALLDRAGITKELVIAGVFDHLEIWTPEAWQAIEQQRTLEQDLEKVYEKKQASSQSGA